MIENTLVGSIMGAPAVGPDDEKIGTVGQVFVEPHTGAPNWATVHTGLFGRHETFVPLDRATFDREVLHLPYDKDTIKDAPRIDTDEALSPDAEAELYRYYGITPDIPSVDSKDAGAPGSGSEPAETSAASPERHPDRDAETAGADYARESRMRRYEASDAAGSGDSGSAEGRPVENTVTPGDSDVPAMDPGFGDPVVDEQGDVSSAGPADETPAPASGDETPPRSGPKHRA
ncbi:hypothetical protein OH146_10780 [Salinibacterium sp. SYSU T00001]|uniref:hypothetical protein n=1 Tax=Homoserinimonas sedimenticola TaxID=2986805 RepID=UPI00223573DB|nr:hypothetical protein [Salinibacterium sedimenticola]MCW4386256.1 hypothetical protein [Salinibacterium sedimenticola]